MSDAPTPFLKAYPAPWRIQGAAILDGNNREVMAGIENDDPEEIMFWQGIVDAVNCFARIEGALQMARAH